jgi:hypothetical protein
VDLSKEARTTIQNATKSAPALINIIEASDMLSRPMDGGLRTTTASKVSFTGISSHDSNTNRSSDGSLIPLKQGVTPIDTSQLRQPVIPSAPVASIVTSDVHLCVEASSRQFTTLDCKGLRTNLEFFSFIKSRYNETRGWFRLWFSTWIYDHCDFFLFQKHGINSSARLGIGFPHYTDLGYDFEPRPPEYLPPHGPITHDEFNFHYYYDLCPSYISWKRWFTTSYFTSSGPSVASRTALDAVPKRTTELNKEDGKRELFYGLYAKEARSAFRVVMYISLCNLPGVILFFLWLFQWGHGSDLQGAAVAVNLSLSLTMGFLGWLYWTR